MTDWCSEPSGPYRITVRGARETVLETRNEVVDVLHAMSVEQRTAATVESGWRHESGEYVYDAMARECLPSDGRGKV